MDISVERQFKFLLMFTTEHIIAWLSWYREQQFLRRLSMATDFATVFITKQIKFSFFTSQKAWLKRCQFYNFINGWSLHCWADLQLWKLSRTKSVSPLEFSSRFVRSRILNWDEIDCKYSLRFTIRITVEIYWRRIGRTNGHWLKSPWPKVNLCSSNKSSLVNTRYSRLAQVECWSLLRQFVETILSRWCWICLHSNKAWRAQTTNFNLENRPAHRFRFD